MFWFNCRNDAHGLVLTTERRGEGRLLGQLGELIPNRYSGKQAHSGAYHAYFGTFRATQVLHATWQLK
jgi:hypothetical protein